MTKSLTRRNFIGLAGLAGLSTLSMPANADDSTTGQEQFVVLFQGDSITDGNRGRSEDPNHILGHGYAFSVASRLGASYPGRNLAFHNRGVSGDTVASLNERWQKDALDLRPNVLSILVGINDIYFRINSGKAREPSMFRRDLGVLLDKTRGSLPQTRIVLCEPFILPVGMVNKNKEAWTDQIAGIQEATSALASEHNCILVRLQKVFTEAQRKAAPGYWIWDGIHPTYNGHGLIANEWLRVVGKNIPQLKYRES